MLRKLLIIACLLCSVNVFAHKQKHHKNDKNVATAAKAEAEDTTNYKEIGAPLPPFIVKKADGKLMTNEDVKIKGNLLLMLFNPTCSHCEDETKLLEDNIHLFHKSKVLMVAARMMDPYMPNFEKAFHVDQYPTITVTRDSSGLVDKTFMYKMLPQINIYNHDRKLIKVFTGDTPIDSLKPYIQ